MPPAQRRGFLGAHASEELERVTIWRSAGIRASEMRRSLFSLPSVVDRWHRNDVRGERAHGHERFDLRIRLAISNARQAGFVRLPRFASARDAVAESQHVVRADTDRAGATVP